MGLRKNSFCKIQLKRKKQGLQKFSALWSQKINWFWGQLWGWKDVELHDTIIHFFQYFPGTLGDLASADWWLTVSIASSIALIFCYGGILSILWNRRGLVGSGKARARAPGQTSKQNTKSISGKNSESKFKKKLPLKVSQENLSFGVGPATFV